MALGIILPLQNIWWGKVAVDIAKLMKRFAGGFKVGTLWRHYRIMPSSIKKSSRSFLARKPVRFRADKHCAPRGTGRTIARLPGVSCEERPVSRSI